MSQHYDKLYDPFVAKGLIREGLIGEASSLVIETEPVFSYVSSLLKLLPEVFADNLPIPLQYY